MIRKVPRLFCNNVDTGIIKSASTPELFTKLGFIDHPKAGLVNWLPMGLSMARKLTEIIRQRMDANGFEEVRLALLQDQDLWRKTGRLDKSSELFKVAGENLLLIPTAEEEITNLIKNSVTTYKSLPVRYYQINTKFRNEKRPRGGLLRGKEFLMKDGYTFDVDEKSAWVSYEHASKAYEEIFSSLKVPFVKAKADSGDMGGSYSHEYHYKHEAGEDTVFVCNGCGSATNVEIALPTKPSEGPSVTKYFAAGPSVISVVLPRDRDLEVGFLKKAANVNDLVPVEETAADICYCDSRVANPPAGAIVTPLVSTQDGDQCDSCGGTLESTRAIEVGHTFFLGDKYSSSLDCTIEVPNEKGEVSRKPMVMGCYGIGVSRILASIAEIQRDEHGFKWPRCLAPWEVTVIEAGNESHSEVFDALHDVDFRLDDRAKLGLGRKAAHSNAVGVPLVVIVGKKYPRVEIEVRGNLEDGWKEERERIKSWEVEGHKHTVDVNDLNRAVKALLRCL